MRYLGNDLHIRFLVIATEDDSESVEHPVRFPCEDVESIRRFSESRHLFRCAIEASSRYRWLYTLPESFRDVVLAHPYQL